MTAGNRAELLVGLLTEKKLTVATAESCTGGMIAQEITSVPGASNVFGYGTVVYANEAKTKLLGVKSETLGRFGAVSRETAEEMAFGLLALSNADIAVSVTGIAGPGGGTPEKPVGTVWIGIATKNGVGAELLPVEPGKKYTRVRIRRMTAEKALEKAYNAALGL